MKPDQATWIAVLGVAIAGCTASASPGGSPTESDAAIDAPAKGGDDANGSTTDDDAGVTSDASASPTDVMAPPPGNDDAAAEATATGVADAGATAAVCGAPGLVVCDDFEGAALDMSKWMAVNVDADNTLTLDTTRAKSGLQSLHVSVSSMAGSALLQTLPLPVLPNNTLWGRAYIYFEAPAPMTHAGVVIGEGTWPAGHDPASAEYEFGMQNGQWTTDYRAGSDENPANSSTNVATGQWSCLEWHFKGDTGDFEEFLDGNLVAGANAQGQPVPAFHDVQMGLDLCCGDSQSVTKFNLWLDAVAIGSQRVNCL